jgi:hypothetical protein
MLTLGNRGARLLPLILLAGTCFAQNPDAAKFYKLDFVVKEVEGAKVLNARSYSMIVSTDKSAPPSSIRTGSKVPYPTGPGSNQYNYAEVGVNIDCRSVQEFGAELSMTITTDISSTPPDQTPLGPVVIRQNKWNSIVVVPLRKPTIVFASDDATTKHQLQLEVTATPLK